MAQQSTLTIYYCCYFVSQDIRVLICFAPFLTFSASLSQAPSDCSLQGFPACESGYSVPARGCVRCRCAWCVPLLPAVGAALGVGAKPAFDATFLCLVQSVGWCPYISQPLCIPTCPTGLLSFSACLSSDILWINVFWSWNFLKLISALCQETAFAKFQCNYPT